MVSGVAPARLGDWNCTNEIDGVVPGAHSLPAAFDALPNTATSTPSKVVMKVRMVMRISLLRAQVRVGVTGRKPVAEAGPLQFAPGDQPIVSATRLVQRSRRWINAIPPRVTGAM